jgi:hypothetical protein
MMKIDWSRGGRFPSPEQENLLKAALLKGGEAQVSFEEWLAVVNLDEIDLASYRLLPLLYSNLKKVGIRHPLMNKLKGVHRQAWYENQMLFQTMADLLRLFRRFGIKTMALKGAALNQLYYEDSGQRPMQDFDILVPSPDAVKAINLMHESCWTSRIPPRQLLKKYRLHFTHACSFRNSAGREMDLHWHVLYTSLDPNADDDFWESAIEIKIQDGSIFAMNPSDQLFHVCVHGAGWNYVPPIRWVADAEKIIDKIPEIDWNRLLFLAEKHCLILPLRETLIYLKEFLKAPIPFDLLQELKEHSISKAMHLEYKARNTPNDTRPPFLELWLQISRYWRLRKNAGALRLILDFPRYLQVAWAIDHLWQIPFVIISRGLARIRNIVVDGRKKIRLG